MNDANAAAADSSVTPPADLKRQWLFWACFIALIATSFGFLIRAFTIDLWAADFALNETQKGEIHSAGLWPFAISIILFSLIIDKIGYGKAMVFAFFCHVGSALLTIFGPDHLDPYWALYLGQFVVALANGTVEAVINPVVATMFPKEKTKWLAILHAGWPAGFVIAGLLSMGVDQFAPEAYTGWQWKVALIFLPTVIYGVMMVGRRFPQQERVTAGASYRDMCKEAGIIGMWIATFLIVSELTRIFMADPFKQWAWSDWTIRGFNALLALVILIPFAIYVRGALGRGLFIVLLLLMLPLASTELSTDAWMPNLMEPAMRNLFGVAGGWVLIYSAAVMMTLRFFAGPLVRVMGPVGLLAVSSAAAAAGLALLATVDQAALILIVITVYAIGQTFFWPCMLGVVSERCPRGGALTLNTIAGVGMLGAGLVGTVLIGNVLDREVEQDLRQTDSALHSQVIADNEKLSMFGRYQPVDPKKVETLPVAQQETIDRIEADSKKAALYKIALVPTVVFAGFVALLIYFKSKGGYKPVDITHGEMKLE